MSDFPGLNDELDPVSMLATLCRKEFQGTPVFRAEEMKSATGHACSFRQTLSVNNVEVCSGDGSNKKFAKSAAAKRALGLIAPNVFRKRFPDEELPKANLPQETVTEQQEFPTNETVRLSDPILECQFHDLYAPMEYLKVYCGRIKNWTLQVEDFQMSDLERKLSGRPGDSVRLLLKVIYEGKVHYHNEVFAPSKQKGL